jgi:hypothetical protein
MACGAYRVLEHVSGQAVPAPVTLSEAHEVLIRGRPRLDAAPRAWVVFHRHSAEVYANVAKVDIGHCHEATHCAGVELRQAREIEDRLSGD